LDPRSDPAAGSGVAERLSGLPKGIAPMPENR